jgi:hypothetical protein
MIANAETTNTTEAAAVAEQGAPVAPEKATSTKTASQKKGGSKGRKSAKAAKPAARKGAAQQAAKKAAKTAAPRADKAQPREGSKKQIVIDLLSRKSGATMAEIAKATGWQKHSIRGFISGTLTKRLDLPVASVRNDKGDRVYRIEK